MPLHGTSSEGEEESERGRWLHDIALDTLPVVPSLSAARTEVSEEAPTETAMASESEFRPEHAMPRSSDHTTAGADAAAAMSSCLCQAMPSREEATTVDARTVEEIAAAEVATEEQLTSPFWLDTGRALGRKAELAPLPGQRPGPSLTPDDGDDGSSGMLDWVGLRTPHSIGKGGSG